MPLILLYVALAIVIIVTSITVAFGTLTARKRGRADRSLSLSAIHASLGAFFTMLTFALIVSFERVNYVSAIAYAATVANVLSACGYLSESALKPMSTYSSRSSDSGRFRHRTLQVILPLGVFIALSVTWMITLTSNAPNAVNYGVVASDACVAFCAVVFATSLYPNLSELIKCVEEALESKRIQPDESEARTKSRAKMQNLLAKTTFVRFCVLSCAALLVSFACVTAVLQLRCDTVPLFGVLYVFLVVNNAFFCLVLVFFASKADESLVKRPVSRQFQGAVMVAFGKKSKSVATPTNRSPVESKDDDEDDEESGPGSDSRIVDRESASLVVAPSNAERMVSLTEVETTVFTARGGDSTRLDESENHTS